MSSHRPCKNVDFLNPRRTKCIQISLDSESCCALSIVKTNVFVLAPSNAVSLNYANETNIVNKGSPTIS